MKRITRLKDIAIETGYSIKTVSRAINNHPDISETTKEKILKVAKRYGYHPNMLARSLRTQKTFTIGYIIPDIKNEFFARVGIVIEELFRKHGYNILIGITKSQSTQEIESLQLLLSKRVDGIVLATVGNTEDYIKRVLNDYKIPIVVIDNKIDVEGLYYVLHDNIKGSYELTRHLIEHGHKRIACITGPLIETSGSERLDGYIKALKENNINIKEEYIKISNWEVEGGYKETLNLIKNTKETPTAIFTANSIMAIGVYKAIKKLELNIPDDIAVVSFDNFDFVEILDPPLTTLGDFSFKIGSKSFEILYAEINNKEELNKEKFEFRFSSNLIKRRSCGCEN